MYLRKFIKKNLKMLGTLYYTISPRKKLSENFESTSIRAGRTKRPLIISMMDNQPDSILTEKISLAGNPQTL